MRDAAAKAPPIRERPGQRPMPYFAVARVPAKRRRRGQRRTPYLSESVNLAQALAEMLSSAPSRSVVSRTNTSPASATPASTQSLPLLEL